MYALITGASSGIGREMALMLAKKGYSLILVARREERLIKLKNQLTARYSIEVETAVYDLSKREDCLSLCKAYQAYPVEVLVNGAGFGKIGYITETPLEEQLSMIDTNVTALHILSRQFAKQMTHGYILNIASIAAFQPGPFLATYGATKAYVASLSIALGYELKKRGKDISVTTLCPGPVDTEFDSVAGTSFSLPSISAKECAKAGLIGMFRKQRLVVPSLAIKASYLATKLSPLEAVLPVTYRIQHSKVAK
jgi:hypothetical protein